MNEDYRLFLIEWLSIMGDYSKSFYERMCDEELRAAYQDILGERAIAN